MDNGWSGDGFVEKVYFLFARVSGAFKLTHKKTSSAISFLLVDIYLIYYKSITYVSSRVVKLENSEGEMTVSVGCHTEALEVRCAKAFPYTTFHELSWVGTKQPLHMQINVRNAIRTHRSKPVPPCL